MHLRTHPHFMRWVRSRGLVGTVEQLHALRSAYLDCRPVPQSDASHKPESGPDGRVRTGCRGDQLSGRTRTALESIVRDTIVQGIT
ncbi:hypothetical protein GFS60_06214 (plasmid) [Rhodococcus sp. WAY2]|nr:hypothetical protein GFS60_06214 [Rhodococcus sp. WAY2]